MRRFRCSAATASTAALLSAAALVSAPGLAPACADGPITHVEWKTFYGDTFSGEFGLAVSGAGDVNKDGHPDIIVGAQERTAFDPANPGRLPGYARVFSGVDGAVLYTFLGDEPSDWFGASVSGAGDINRDGYADLVIGARRGGLLDHGYVRVLSGSDGTTIDTFQGDEQGDELGVSVSGGGDVNRDGYPDIIAGAWSPFGGGPGTVRVYSGFDGVELYSLSGRPESDSLGRPVSSVGDVDDDGYDDFVGVDLSLGSPAPGYALLFSGRDGSVILNIDAVNLGGSITDAGHVGDVNGDGVPDVAYLGSNGTEGFEQAIVYSVTEEAVVLHIEGEFGLELGGAGDVNGDGYDDLIVGDHNAQQDGQRLGAAYVYSGFDGLPIYTFLGDEQGDDFGRAVSNAGDLNGDGYDDFLVGAPFGGPDRTGFARVFLSTPTANLGDTNADRAIDLLDFDVLAQNFGAPGNGVSAPNGPEDADFNNDGVVDLLDFDLLARNYGLPAQAGASIPAVIPEPASATLLALAGPLLLRGRGWWRQRR